MTGRSNANIEVIKPNQKEVESLKKICKHYDFKTWYGASVGMKKFVVKIKECNEKEASDMAASIIEIIKNVGVKKEIRVYVKSYFSWVCRK